MCSARPKTLEPSAMDKFENAEASFLNVTDIPSLVALLESSVSNVTPVDTALKRPRLVHSSGDEENLFGIPSADFHGEPFVSLAIRQLSKLALYQYEKKYVEHANCDDKLDGQATGQKAIERIQALLSYTRDKFNIGHWRDVRSFWRKLYTCLTVLKITFLAMDSQNSHSVIKECDMGLIMGQPILENVLGKMAYEISAKIILDQSKIHSIQQGNGPTPIPVEVPSCQEFPIKNKSRKELPLNISCAPSLQQFRKKHLIPNIPCHLVRTFNWPAMQKWNVEYINEVAGFRTVPVEIGDKYTSASWTQKIMTISNFIKDHMGNDMETPSTGYIAQYTLFEQIGQLNDDIEVPKFCGLSAEHSDTEGEQFQKRLDNVEINCWFGPANTISPCHYDPKHNILVQIFGRKCIRLFPPGQKEHLRPHPESSMLFNTSQLDVEQDNLFEEYPNMEHVVHLDVILEPGDALYIPPKWWHYVKSLSPSFSISFWFDHD